MLGLMIGASMISVQSGVLSPPKTGGHLFPAPIRGYAGYGGGTGTDNRVPLDVVRRLTPERG